jgi:hypothetical protein
VVRGVCYEEGGRLIEWYFLLVWSLGGRDSFMWEVWALVRLGKNKSSMVAEMLSSR